MFWKKKEIKKPSYQLDVLVTKYPIPGEDYNFLEVEYGGGYRSLGDLYQLGYTLDYILYAPYNSRGKDDYHFPDKTIQPGEMVYYHYLKRERSS